MSRISARLEDEQRAWRERPLGEKACPYLYLDATYLKVRWGAHGVTSVALLACVGVNEEGYREVPWPSRSPGGEKGAAYASLLRGLLDRGLKGVRLVVSDDHEGMKAAVAGELPGVQGRRCVVHFQRNVLAHVPAKAMGEAAEDLKAIFLPAKREKTAKASAEEPVAPRGESYPEAVEVFDAGIGQALTYLLRHPSSHHARGYARRSTCWRGCSRRRSGGRGWWGCSPTRKRARASWRRR